MIVARITDQLRNRNPKTPGSARLQGFEHWFPLNSVDFALSGRDESNSTLAPSSNTGFVPAPPVAPQKGRSENNVSCAKFVDVASSALMYLSICDKLKDRQGESRAAELLAADIHFVEVASAGLGAGGSANASSVVTFLKIALEDVTIDGWSFSGAADDRPSETFNLKYEKIAIQYIQYDEKGNMMPSNARGFSQADLDDWIPASWKGKRS